MTDRTTMDRVAAEWLAARNIIADFLAEVRLLPRDHLEHNAAAILARLASHEPPILTGYDHETELRDALEAMVQSYGIHGPCRHHSCGGQCQAAYRLAKKALRGTR